MHEYEELIVETLAYQDSVDVTQEDDAESGYRPEPPFTKTLLPGPLGQRSDGKTDTTVECPRRGRDPRPRSPKHFHDDFSPYDRRNIHHLERGLVSHEDGLFNYKRTMLIRP